MPSYETSADRSRRPFSGRAGEVTKKKNNESIEDDAEDQPPVFHGKKIGGAKDLLGKDVSVQQHGTKQKVQRISEISGVQAIDYETANRSQRKKPPGAAPTGKRRVWACVSDVQKQSWSDLSDLWVSSICKKCLEDDVPCSGWEPEQRPVPPRIKLAFSGNEEGHWSQMGKEKQKITTTDLFQPTVCDSWDLDKGNLRCQNCITQSQACFRMVEYPKLNKTEYHKSSPGPPRNRAALRKDPLHIFKLWSTLVQGTFLSIDPTPQADVQPPHVLAQPSQTGISSHQDSDSFKSGMTNAAPKSGPTYSQARNAYENLAEDNYHRQCLIPERTDWDSEPSFWWETGRTVTTAYLPLRQPLGLERFVQPVPRNYLQPSAPPERQLTDDNDDRYDRPRSVQTERLSTRPPRNRYDEDPVMMRDMLRCLMEIACRGQNVESSD